MLSKFHQNGVMHGCIDFFCLVCDIELRTEVEVIAHIDKPRHDKNLDANKYEESCFEDRIRKVNKGYYCEFCNILILNMIEIKLHIQEDKHAFNKTYRSEREMKNSVFLKWVNKAVIAFDDLLIDDKAWNGFIDNTCIVCDDDFEDLEIHKSETWHKLKLIQAKVQVGADIFITRKIDDSNFQCLTCNVVVSGHEIMRHFDKCEHTKLYLESRKAKRALTENIENISTENRTAGEKELKDAQKNIIFTKQESKSYKTNQENQSAEKVPRYKLSKEFTTHPDAVLGLKDYIEMFSNDGEATCFLCQWKIRRNQVPKHVNGEHHNTLLEMQNDRFEKIKKKYGVPNNSAEQSEMEPAIRNLLAEVRPQLSQEKETNREKIIDSISDFQKNGVRIDLIGDKAFCMKCSNDIDFTFDAVKKHIEDHKNLTAETSGEKYPRGDLNKTEFNRQLEENKSGKMNSSGLSNKAVDPETFAKENKLTCNIDHSLAFCRICDCKVPSSVKSMREHVNGYAHQLNNKLANDKPKDAAEPKKANSPLYKTKPMDDFIVSLSSVEIAFSRDAIINDLICINIMSYKMITRNDDYLHCLVCEQNLTRNEVEEHNKTRRHERAMRMTPVLYNLNSEFVREVRADVFHCGFCNLVSAGYQSLQQHLRSSAHEREKSMCGWRLKNYMPQVLAQRTQEEEEMQLDIALRWFMEGAPSFMR